MARLPGRRAESLRSPQTELEIKRMDETGIDRDTMARLARSLSFIKNPDDPVVTALKQAAESGTERDIKRARALFLKLKSADRRSALAAIGDSG
jgi:hypothetical protein